MSSRFPSFASCCPKPAFLNVIGDFSRAWSDIVKQARAADLLHGIDGNTALAASDGCSEEDSDPASSPGKRMAQIIPASEPASCERSTTPGGPQGQQPAKAKAEPHPTSPALAASTASARRVQEDWPALPALPSKGRGRARATCERLTNAAQHFIARNAGEAIDLLLHLSSLAPWPGTCLSPDSLLRDDPLLERPPADGRLGCACLLSPAPPRWMFCTNPLF